jgi:hypothetical protein
VNPHISAHVRWVELRDGTLIAYNMRSAEYLEVRAALTVRIWLALDGSRSVAGIVEHVNARRTPEVPPLTVRMAERLVAGLSTMGLVSGAEVAARPAGAGPAGALRPGEDRQ